MHVFTVKFTYTYALTGRSIANWSCVVDGNGTVDEVFTGAMCDCPGTLLLSDESSIVAEVHT